MSVLQHSKNKSKRYVLSALSRAANRDQPLELTSYTVPDLLANTKLPATPFDVLDTILLHIHRLAPSLTGYTTIPFTDYPIFFLQSAGELREFLEKLKAMGLIEGAESDSGFTYRLALKGWQRIPELRRVGRSSRQAFVAMWFTSDLRQVWDEGIQPALQDAGWDPVRIDAVEHNQKIDDRIIAEIRKSGMLIADFTGNRGGVYFEAGFAMGLGIPVVWAVRESDIGSVHFDTRQYNHIVWNDADDLRTKLYNRVIATVVPPGS